MLILELTEQPSSLGEKREGASAKEGLAMEL
jgi:hypothetical protein